MKYALLALLLIGCATAPSAQKQFDLAYEHCEELAGKDVHVGRACLVDLWMRAGIPVKCTYLRMDGKVDEATRCIFEAREASQNERRQREAQQRAQTVDLSPLNFLATQWNAPKATQPRAPICTTLSHYDGYGKLVTESSCQ